MNKVKRRSLSPFATHILICATILATVFCIGYITTLDYMSSMYKSACEFYVLLLAEIVSFTCLADYIYKTT
jgi:predicted CDP-diglyceride synthetase/phosphatidate cytidylyltransferase